MRYTSEILFHDTEFPIHSACMITDLLHFAWAEVVVRSGVEDKGYRQDWSFDLAAPIEPDRIIQDARLWISRLGSFDPGLQDLLSDIPLQLEELPGLSAAAMLIVHVEMVTRIATVFHLEDNAHSLPGISVTTENGYLNFKLPCSAPGEPPLLAAASVIRRIADQNRRPTIEEYICLNAASYELMRGRSYSAPAVPWGVPGFRTHQTVMSVTDPGVGHLHGTCLANQHLDGVIVHIEHLERGVNISREEIEPYRIPMPSIVPRVSLWTASRAPVSTYVGRPAFDGDSGMSMLKTVHTMAAACNDFFTNGISECKVAVEKMPASQAISFLKALAGNTRRDTSRQILSAAFCLNAPILNDLDGEPALITDKLEIGLLGIRIAAEAGLNKVTWDGTADTYPSSCIIEQLGYDKALTLVHRAHERGLLTYFSAGFRFPQISTAVHTGVDGIGIGGAQILRFMDYDNGNHGPFKTANIVKILEARNYAEAQTPGIAAKLLARLDQMKFEGVLTPGQDELRMQLFEAMKAGDEIRILAIRESLPEIAGLEDDISTPMALSSARRLLNRISTSENPIPPAPVISLLRRAIDASDPTMANIALRQHSKVSSARA